MVKSEHISRMLLIAFTGFFISLGCFAMLIYQDLQIVRKNNEQQEKLIEFFHTTTHLNIHLENIHEDIANCKPQNEDCRKRANLSISEYQKELASLKSYLSGRDLELYKKLQEESRIYLSDIKLAYVKGDTRSKKILSPVKARNAPAGKIQTLITALETHQRSPKTTVEKSIIRNRTNVFIMIGISASILMFFIVNFFLLQLSLRKRAEAERKSKKNEEKFETLFYHSPVMFLMVDAFSLEVINANNNILRFLNLEREAIVGKAIASLNILKSAPDKALIRKIITENTQVRDHVTSIVLNGSEHRYISCNFDKVIIDGKTTLFIAFFDITVQKEAEQAIKESQDQFATLFYKNPSILALTDIATNHIIDINDRYADFFGYSREELVGRAAPLFGINSDTELQGSNNPVSAVNQYRDSVGVSVRTKAGVVKYIQHFAETINIRGKQQRLVCFQDITDIRKTQSILKKNEEIYSSLFYKSPVILCITEAQSGKFIDINNNFCNFFKFRKEQLLGVTSRELKIWMKYSERIFMLQRLHNGETVSNIELHLRAADGEEKCVYAHVDLIDIDGKECLICAFTDAAEEKKARQEILKLNEVLEQRVIERTKEIRDYKHALDESAIIVITDRRGLVQHVNNNFTLISQYTFREVAGKKIDIMKRTSRGDLEQKILATIRQGKVWKGEIEQRTKDGAVYWTHTHIIPFSDTRNHPYQYLIIGWDITQKKLAEIENERVTRDLIQRNKNLEQYAYIISHNLRAPVSNIMGLMQLLQLQDISEGERQAFNQDLSSCINKLDEIIIDLNSILRSSRQLAETKEEINLNRMVDSIKGSISNIIEDEHAMIECDFSDVSNIYTTKSYLNSILYNLISNSIKYRKPDQEPLISIKSARTNGSVVINYSDNGLGIDLEKYGDKVFGLYKRFHPHKEGRGMGLFMVKTQVETLGGKINIESQAGAGTSFTIELPVYS